MTPPCCPTCQTCPSHSLMPKEEKLALVFLAGPALNTMNALCTKVVRFNPPLLLFRATPEPQDELTSSNIPPTLSSSRMLHRLVVEIYSLPSNSCAGLRTTQCLNSTGSACPVALGHRGCIRAGDAQSTSLGSPGQVLPLYQRGSVTWAWPL